MIQNLSYPTTDKLLQSSPKLYLKIKLKNQHHISPSVITLFIKPFFNGFDYQMLLRIPDKDSVCYNNILYIMQYLFKFIIIYGMSQTLHICLLLPPRALRLTRASPEAITFLTAVDGSEIFPVYPSSAPYTLARLLTLEGRTYPSSQYPTNFPCAMHPFSTKGLG